LALSSNYQKQLISDDLDVLQKAKATYHDDGTINENEWSTKELSKQIAKLNIKYEKLDNANNVDDHLTFEQLDIDDITIDESHEFKNLNYQTILTNVAGMGQPKGSDRANDLYNKIRYLQSKNNTGVCF